MPDHPMDPIGLPRVIPVALPTVHCDRMLIDRLIVLTEKPKCARIDIRR